MCSARLAPKIHNSAPAKKYKPIRTTSVFAANINIPSQYLIAIKHIAKKPIIDNIMFLSL